MALWSGWRGGVAESGGYNAGIWLSYRKDTINSSKNFALNTIVQTDVTNSPFYGFSLRCLAIE